MDTLRPPLRGPSRRTTQAISAFLFGMAIAVSGTSIPGCSSAPTVSADPIADLDNQKLSDEEHAAAVDQAWAEMMSGKGDRFSLRESFKKHLFLMSTGDQARLRIVEKLISDTDPEGIADTRNVLRLRLPRESSWPIITLVSKTSAERGWTEMTPALVRSLARRPNGTPEEERPERAALLQLHPGKSIEEIVYDVFIGQATAPVAATPPTGKGSGTNPTNAPKGTLPLGATKGGRSMLDERVQSDAWELLGRLDKDGSRRAALLAEDTRVTGTDGQDPVLADLRACAKDLKAVPITGPELEWVRTLRTPGNTINTAWWQASAQAIAALTPEQSTGLELRHIEPIRWASLNRPQWVKSSREQLRVELDARLRPRKAFARRAEQNDAIRTPMETMQEWDASLSWADLLTILVIDDALADSRVKSEIWAQANEDRANKQTEYGGAIEPIWPGGDPKRAAQGTSDSLFEARLYLPVTPRPLISQAGDTRFVASEQMISSTPRSLAHYHFHVQETRNEKYAGPSRGDLDYAASYARNCLVFTSVGEDLMDVDFYQRNGARIDLGEFRRPR